MHDACAPILFLMLSRNYVETICALFLFLMKYEHAAQAAAEFNSAILCIKWNTEKKRKKRHSRAQLVFHHILL